MRDSKNMVIGMLCAVVCVMAVAYAAFGTALNVKTTATVASNWCIRAEKVEPNCTVTPLATGVQEGVTAKVEIDANSLGAVVTMNFIQPGDTATCTVNYTNCGDLNAALTHKVLNTTGGSSTNVEIDSVTGTATYRTADNGIEFTVTGLNVNTLAKTASTPITITARYLDVDNQSSPEIKTASISIQSSASQSV